MKDSHPVICATDFSSPARHAARRAALLSEASGAPLTLFHAVADTALEDLRRWLTESSSAAEGEQAAAWVKNEAQQHLQSLADELNRRCGARIQTQWATGNLVEQLARHADEVDAGLLVTGARGAGYLRSAMVGSTAERLARRAGRPVLVVRQMPHGPYQRVLIPVDFSDWSRCAIQLARRVAPQAQLVLMHAVELPFQGKMRLAGVSEATVSRYMRQALQEAESRLRSLVAEAGLNPDEVPVVTPTGADPWMLIAKEEQERDCDLIVMGRQGRHALDALLLGSTTRMVLAEGTADVLICSQSAVAAPTV